MTGNIKKSRSRNRPRSRRRTRGGRKSRSRNRSRNRKRSRRHTRRKRKEKKRKRGGTTPAIRKAERLRRNQTDINRVMRRDARVIPPQATTLAEDAVWEERRIRRLENTGRLSRLLNKRQYREDMGNDQERESAMIFPGQQNQRIRRTMRDTNWGPSYQTRRAAQNYAEDRTRDR